MEEIAINRTIAYKVLMIAAIMVSLSGLLFLLLVSLESAYSVILGGVAFILPNVIFVRFSLQTSVTGSSNSVLVFFYIGEAIKIVATIIIFVAALVLFAPLNIGLMFFTYGSVLLMNLVGLAILMNK